MERERDEEGEKGRKDKERQGVSSFWSVLATICHTPRMREPQNNILVAALCASFFAKSRLRAEEPPTTHRHRTAPVVYIAHDIATTGLDVRVRVWGGAVALAGLPWASSQALVA